MEGNLCNTLRRELQQAAEHRAPNKQESWSNITSVSPAGTAYSQTGETSSTKLKPDPITGFGNRYGMPPDEKRSGRAGITPRGSERLLPGAPTGLTVSNTDSAFVLRGDREILGIPGKPSKHQGGGYP
ncbi:hypothetical protein GBF38_001732 [Nibea albiflora]|uniref:Uncharacterized protein n=1 Tax=Nibea albiflora TaxID=240163 RepID=A0ACB7EU44_NIBAL|nr:hypothetical protein GBF38_001732 [Nibea albiflora]